MIKITVPSPGESINEVQIAAWLVEDGQYVEKDQDIVEIDSDKATLAVAAEASGRIRILAKEGDVVEVGAVIAEIDESQTGGTESTKKEEQEQPSENQKKPENKVEAKEKVPEASEKSRKSEPVPELNISPLARKLLEQHDMTESDLVDFLKKYRITRKDVEFFLEEKEKVRTEVPQAKADTTSWQGTRKVERKKMTMLRRKLSERLVSVKNETAMLTTFNEVNMTPVIELRRKYKEIFKEKHGVSLGFVSFFTKAVTEAIAHFPVINSQIDGDEIVTFDYVDVGIAVSAPKGLVVPVIRNAEMLSLAEIEKEVKRLAGKARENKITIQDMEGGTFTITNGGVFGSMMSTPIINPPQSSILGMHNIVERPVAVNGKVEIHPVMYIALSYDHRLIDGRESVGFLVKVKEMLENPVKMLFGAKDPGEVLLGL
jgi:2-oxoglutarate dehydrogenase E2 component (dihydrolipoamide succinyltransferase)